MAQRNQGDLPRRIGQIALTVQDVDRAAAFYRDVVGLDYLFSAPPGLVFLRCGEVRLMLSRPEGGEDHPASILYFDVEDLEGAHRRLASAGTEVVRAPGVVHRTDDSELRIGFYRDGEGNTFGLMHEGPPAEGVTDA